ncbi:putative ATPase [Actinocorallia herbida]|uniref:Putative ATPase n=1 Tax=Actinocorallia herbida TaxID=58109 RepID=A0A3N1DCU9_9ACTN|nr:LuxR C-terminal-related transcriptional regulator [Actinocorallia herbida]ROO91296.1 putative ATPase [Actinocorallia herbida]
MHEPSPVAAGNLPAPASRLIGRRREVADVRRLLAGSRLLTLTGVGGVGKTRVALAAAADLADAAPDGVWFVELSALRDEGLLAYAVRAGLGLRDRDLRAPVAVLRDHLSGRRALLVLDTCEHLVGACGELVSGLLAAAPGLRVLATSRQPLRVPGERTLALAPLPPGDHAVTLFHTLAAEADPGFDRDRDLAVALCERLDGLPLAIELAAVRLRTLTVRQLVARLDDRFRLLEEPGREGRHGNLRTAVGWSHELCEPRERLLWARLSVFNGDFDLEGAEHVCADGTLPAEAVLDVLAGLVDKSIVVREPGGERFRMLDTVREYGATWLAGLGEEPALRRRHRDHFLEMARRFDEGWAGAEQYAWFDRMNAEFSNLRAALDFSLADPEEEEAGYELARRLRYLWVACGYVREGAYYLDKVLERRPSCTDVRTVRHWLSAFLGVLPPESVFGLWAEASERAAPEERGWFAYNCGNALFTVGDLEAALGWYARGCALFAEAGGAMPGLALSMVGHAACLLRTGHPEKAIVLLEEQRALCARSGDVYARSFGDWMQAMAELAVGRADLAGARLRAAVVVKRRLSDHLGVAMAVDAFAAIALAQDDPERAAALLGGVQRMRDDYGMGPGLTEYVEDRAVCEAKTRELLGPRAFHTAFTAGTRRSLDETVAYALGDGEAASRPALTPRQREIALLVAAGLSNRQIGERLTIAKKTVDSHVEQILSKLGFGSRAQVAAWIGRGGR